MSFCLRRWDETSGPDNPCQFFRRGKSESDQSGAFKGVQSRKRFREILLRTRRCCGAIHRLGLSFFPIGESESAQPIPGSAPLVCHGQNLNDFAGLSVPDGVWKALQCGSPNVQTQLYRVTMGILAHVLKDRFKLSQVGSTKTRLPSTRSKRWNRDIPPPPRGGIRSSPEQRPGLSPDFLCRDRLYFTAINLPRPLFRFDEPGFSDLFL